MSEIIREWPNLDEGTREQLIREADDAQYDKETWAKLKEMKI